MKRHIDVVLYLGRQGLALRGYKECGGRDVNEGNFIELLKLLAKYDGLLNDHLNFTICKPFLPQFKNTKRFH